MTLIPPPDSEVLKFPSFERLEFGVFRLVMQVGDNRFKRLWEAGFRHPRVCWFLDEGTISETQALDQQKQDELESIFRAHCLSLKYDMDEITRPKRLKR